MKLSIIIPVYHEEKNILKVVSLIQQKVSTPHEILIVYDSMADPTYHVLKHFEKKNSYQLLLIKNTSGNGKGVMNAIKTGIVSAKGTAIVVVMADLADDISQIDTMYQLIMQGYDIICASRFMQGGRKIGGPVMKTILSRLACAALYFLFRIPTHDATNAFKMYRASVLHVITIDSKGGFEYSLEIILKAYRQGYAITEIPTIWRDREEGKSNFKLLSWLPNYLYWFFSIFGWYKSLMYSIGITVLILLSLLLSLLQLGEQFHQKIHLESTLDFSWVSDAIQRLNEGYIAGRDYIFTYGPSFQFMNALPGFLFHLPSYIAAEFGAILTSGVFLVLLSIITSMVIPKKKDALLFFGILVFIMGYGDYSTANIFLRVMLPFLYSLYWVNHIDKQKTLIPYIVLSILPALFGTYSYDLFLQLLLLHCLLSIYKIAQTLIYSKQINNTYSVRIKNIVGIISITIGILLSEGLLSLLISHNLSYIYYSLSTISDYYYVMNSVWEYGKANILFIYPLIMLILFIINCYDNQTTGKQKEIGGVLVLTAITSLRIALIRSDSGHIIMSIIPSIFVTSFLLYVLRNKINLSILCYISVLVYILLPLKKNYYSYLSVSNITEIVNIIKTKPSFFTLFTVNEKNGLTMKDTITVSKLIAHNKNNIFVYPYDSYLLNINDTTFNSFALQLYDYSNSAVESKTVLNMKNHPPHFIILGIDTISAIALDNIPNFNRNPLFANWIITHYHIQLKTNTYLVLAYGKSSHRKIRSDLCNEYKIVVSSPRNKLSAPVFGLKYPLYYTKLQLTRIPLNSMESVYYLFPQSNTVTGISNLFDGYSLARSVKNNITIMEQNPFTHSLLTDQQLSNDLTITCIR